MVRNRATFALLLILGLASTAAEAQLLKKLKKAADKALDVAEEVDRFTFDEAEEIELGEAISARIRARYGVLQDREATRYLSLVGLTIAAHSGRLELPWTWIILDSDSVNAFATPGGFVHITRGALAVMRSEAELASVLAHEAAHITRKHTLKGLQKSMGLELAQNQADFTRGSDFFNAVADQATRAVLAGFSQAEELEADEEGIEIASRAGYQPRGLPQFLFTLADASSGASSHSSLFRSHPDTEERIEKSVRQIEAQDLDRGVWLEERFDNEVSYEVASVSTGGPAVAGARGIAGADEETSEETEPEASEESRESADDDGGGRFSLAQLATDPFATGTQEESTEVTGAGAGRAVGEEDAEAEGGPKNPQIVVIEIKPAELAAFKKEGGLP